MVERAYVRAESNTQSNEDTNVYPPPDRERIAVSISCVQHPLYLKTYTSIWVEEGMLSTCVDQLILGVKDG